MTECIVAENVGYVYEYPQGPFIRRTVGLVDASLRINCGERVVLVGANGSGKTTLLRAISGTHKCTGKLTVLGRDAFEDTTLNADVAYVGDRWPSRYGWANTVKDLVTMFPNPNWDRILLLCEKLHVDLTWRVDKISDGMRRRVQILMGLLFEKKVLVMDECTPDLDLVERSSMLDFLTEQSEQHGVTVVICSHIFDFLSDWPTKVVHMAKGKTLDVITPADFGGRTIQQIAYSWIGEDLGVLDPNCSTMGDTKFPSSPTKKQADRETVINTKNFFFTMGDTKSRWGYGTDVFKGLTLEVLKGQRVLLVGTNGSGKSTLLRVLAGKHIIPEDSAFVCGRPSFHDTTLHEILGFSGSWWDESPWDMSVAEMLDLDPERKNIDPRTQELLKVLSIDLDWRMNKVSLGQRTRIQLLLALRVFKPILLLDEITAYLDVCQRIDLLRWIWKESEENGCTIVYSTHIFEGMDGWASDAIVLNSVSGQMELSTSLQGDALGGQRLLDWVAVKMRALKKSEWELIAQRTETTAKAAMK
eukprot:TRINITY_DN58015_c0_g1_i1.p1 TRINITY_DN58015_c0_g1~~TRINITY_DN58015_c0_g1_i1.p1  ORF type:complete len:530 (-),score=43.18 TRINITY_DN58015_c0_g1_i1:108-1697(-)